MDKEILLETLKQYLKAEISNNMNFSKDNVELILGNGVKIKITAKEKA